MKTLTFNPGGLHLEGFKRKTENLPIENMYDPPKVVIPLLQHTGLPAVPNVKVGDHVKIGQKIGDAQSDFSVPVHSSISGEVIAVNSYAITIKNDNMSEWFMLNTESKNLYEKEELLKEIKESGIVGLGGACFPTHIKLNPPPDAKIDTLIINGAECEPYLTCDYRLMLEEGELIFDGIEIVEKILNPKNIYIGIEENKKNAIIKLRDLGNNRKSKVEIVALKEKYPQGAEKQLIYAITGRKVPVGKLPFNVGVVVHNVGTIHAIAGAINLKKALIERVITVSGDCISEPKNLRVKIGTTLEDVVNKCGGFTEEPSKIIFGGPMMGVTQSTLDVPIVKGTSGVVFLKNIPLTEEGNCIRCGKCIVSCPSGLMPVRIMECSKNNEFDNAEKYFATSCIECGLCSYVCPSKIEILSYIRNAKVEITKRRKRK
ncbi:MAG TPA: electron transport complex subunit RsxC [Caldisericia bacterium]|nr:electron transport complex subunit RsxC [Caldisericia bacterium]